METLLITLHYAICAFLIITILLQAGKGADIGAVFGGGSQTVFGSRGPTTFLNKITVIVAFAFLVTSIWLAQISKTRSATSVLDNAVTTEESIPQKEEIPASTDTTVPEKAPEGKADTEKAE